MQGRSDERRIGQTCEKWRTSRVPLRMLRERTGRRRVAGPRERKGTVSLEQESVHAPLPGNQIILLQISLVLAANAEM